MSRLAEIMQVYQGSDGDRTKALYAELESLGHAGVVAVNLFRACKASERAKLYRGRRYKGPAYDKKQWSIENLCRALGERPLQPPVRWGWAIDARMRESGDPHYWVIYVDLPTGQVSFHSDHRPQFGGPDYDGGWDGAKGTGPERICRWATSLLEAAP